MWTLGSLKKSVDAMSFIYYYSLQVKRPTMTQTFMSAEIFEAPKDFNNTVKYLDIFTKMEGESSLESSENAHVYPERY